MSENGPSHRRRRHQARDLLRCTSHLGGLLVALRHLAGRVNCLNKPVEAFGSALEKYTDWRTAAFDRHYGTDTFTRITLAELKVDQKSNYNFEGWGYCPVNDQFFHEMMRYTPVSPRDYCFIDVGCGKGKAVMLATDYSFSRVIGVEISADLASVAKSNVEKYAAAKQRSPVAEVVCQDFMTYELPAVPTVFFFNDPFPLNIADRAISHLEASCKQHPRPIYVIYRKAPMDVVERLDQSSALKLHCSTPFWLIYRNQ